MITEHDLQEAISECLGQRNPSAQTCIKLAAFYTIKNSLYGDSAPPENRSYSYAAPPVNKDEQSIRYESDTEFSRAIKGKTVYEVMSVIDELMETLSAINPRLYAGVLRKFQ